MVSGLKFIKINKDSQNKVTGLTVKADDDDNHPFDDEDTFLMRALCGMQEMNTIATTSAMAMTAL